MGVALFFRVWLLMINGLNSDESVYAGQGAAMFGLEQFPRYFSLFRAHPLLMQGSVGVVYRLFGTSDVAARLVAVAFGMVAVAATWAAARELYGRRVGLYSLAFVAVLPYHALVSRQVLVDTPLGACIALAFFALARGVRRNRPSWIVGSAVLFGLAVLSKETAVIFIPIALVIVFFERRSGRLQKPNLLLWSAVGFGLAVAPFPLTRLVHSPKNAGAFFLWQFARDPNHTRDYFARSMLQFGTPLFVALVLAGVVMFVLRRSRTDVFLLLWAVPPFAFYTLWPTKLFPYLFPILPALCIAAAVCVARVVDATRVGLRSHVAARSPASPFPLRSLGSW